MSFVWPYGEHGLEDMEFFCNVLIRNQYLFFLPEFKFFKEFIESFGGMIHKNPRQPDPLPKTPDSEPESELKFDTKGCVLLEPDEIRPDQKMGDPKKKVSDKDREKAIEKRTIAMEEFHSGNIEKAVKLYTEAIELDPTAYLLYAKRGQAYLKLTRPNACIQDCTRALKIREECAQAYKYRGRAFQLLGDYLNAWFDLKCASEIDLDDDIATWLKELSEHGKKIEERMCKIQTKRTYERALEETLKVRKKREEYIENLNANLVSAEEKAEHLKIAVKLDEVLYNSDIEKYMYDPQLRAAVKEMAKHPEKSRKYEKCPKMKGFLDNMYKTFLEGGISPDTLEKFYARGAFATVSNEELRKAAAVPKVEPELPPTRKRRNPIEKSSFSKTD